MLLVLLHSKQKQCRKTLGIGRNITAATLDIRHLYHCLAIISTVSTAGAKRVRLKLMVLQEAERGKRKALFLQNPSIRRHWNYLLHLEGARGI